MKDNNTSPTSKPTSVDELVDGIFGTDYSDYPHADPETPEEVKANIRFSEAISKLNRETKAKINRLIVEKQIEVYKKLMPINRRIYGEDSLRVREANNELAALTKELEGVTK